MDIQRILVGTDVSENALAAVDNAAAVARRTGAKLVLAYATPIAAHEQPATAGHAQLARMYLEDARGELLWLAERCIERGVPVNTEILTGLPAESLVSEGERIDADLTVVGTHGYTGFERLLLGSVAQRVVRGANASVMVVRTRPPEDGFRRVLVATDFSTAADDTVGAAKLLVARGGTIDVVHFWQAPIYRLPPAAQDAPTQGTHDRARVASLADARAAGEALVARHATDDATLTFDLQEDAPGRGIQRRISARDYDCAIVGSHGHRGFKRWLLGSVAERAVRDSPCTVVVVRSRA